MKTRKMKWTLFLALFGPVCIAEAQSFTSNGVKYNILSATDKTVEVGNNRTYQQPTLFIPELVTYKGMDFHVTQVADSAFCYPIEIEKESPLTTVKISCGVKRIGKAAFYNCSSLTNLELPRGLKMIDEDAFTSCISLTDIDFPEGLEHIGSYAFRECRLHTFKAPSTLKSIGDCTFYRKSLESIELNEGLESIGEMCFAWNINIKEVKLPRSLRNIGRAAFSVNGYTSIHIPDTWTEIPEEAFVDCPDLTEISLPTGLKTIRSFAFAGCQSLKSLTLPHTVENVEESAFDGTTLFDIKILNINTKFGENALKAPVENYVEKPIFNSNHPEIVSVDSEGTLHIHQTGTATITTKGKHPETHQPTESKCVVQIQNF